MFRRLVLSVIAAMLLVTSSSAQQFVRLADDDGAPIDTANPLSVGVSTLTTITNPVGIKGLDGSGIATNLNALPVVPDGVATANITNANQSISSSVTTITFTAPIHHLKMWSSAGASDLNFTFNGATPDTTKPTLYGGAAYADDFGVAISTMKYKGVGTTGTLNYVAR